jgi:hypothetical protein
MSARLAWATVGFLAGNLAQGALHRFGPYDGPAEMIAIILCCWVPVIVAEHVIAAKSTPD